MSLSEPLPSDEALVAAVRAGDREAVAALTQRYWHALRRFAAAYLRDEALGEDVAQETVARLADGSSLPTGPVKPWLYRIARNRCLDLLRHWQRSPTHHRPLADPGAAQGGHGPRTRALLDERREQIRAVIEHLPDDYKSVLLLKYYEGMSREDIAATLEITDIAVKGRLARGADYLQAELRKLSSSAGS